MKSVTINGREHDSYASLAEADEYLDASVAADDWDGTPLADRARALVEATRLLDRQRWAQPYDDRAQRAASVRVVHACIEIAALVAQGAVSILTASSTNDMIKSIKAGSVAIEYTGKSTAGERFPANLLEILDGMLLSSGSRPVGVALGGGLSYGTDTVSTGNESFGVTRA